MTHSVMKFGVVRFIVAIIVLIVIIQVLTTIHFSSTHWPDDHPVVGNRHVGRTHWKIRSHVEETQVRCWQQHKTTLKLFTLSCQ